MLPALLLAFALTAAPRAHAFCGFFVGKADSALFNRSSQVAIVRDGDTVCVSGFVGIGTPDELLALWRETR